MNKTIDFNNIELNTYNGKVVLDEIYWRAIDDTILVVEPSVEDTNKIIVFIMNKIGVQEKDGKETIEFDLTGEEILKFMLPILTNLKFDLKNPDHKRLFDLILETQPKPILKVAKYINDIVSDITSDIKKVKEYVSDIDDEKMKEYLLEIKDLME